MTQFGRRWPAVLTPARAVMVVARKRRTMCDRRSKPSWWSPRARGTTAPAGPAARPWRRIAPEDLAWIAVIAGQALPCRRDRMAVSPDSTALSVPRSQPLPRLAAASQAGAARGGAVNACAIGDAVHPRRGRDPARSRSASGDRSRSSSHSSPSAGCWSGRFWDRNGGAPSCRELLRATPAFRSPPRRGPPDGPADHLLVTIRWRGLTENRPRTPGHVPTCWIALRVAAAATAIFVLPAVITDATLGQSGPLASGHIPTRARTTSLSSTEGHRSSTTSPSTSTSCPSRSSPSYGRSTAPSRPSRSRCACCPASACWPSSRCSAR